MLSSQMIRLVLEAHVTCDSLVLEPSAGSFGRGKVWYAGAEAGMYACRKGRRGESSRKILHLGRIVFIRIA